MEINSSLLSDLKTHPLRISHSLLRQTLNTLQLGKTCSKVSECDSEPCHVMARCADTAEGHTCTCRDGYDGDGVSSCSGQFPLLSFLIWSFILLSFVICSFIHFPLMALRTTSYVFFYKLLGLYVGTFVETVVSKSTCFIINM